MTAPAEVRTGSPDPAPLQDDFVVVKRSYIAGSEVIFHFTARGGMEKKAEISFLSERTGELVAAVVLDWTNNWLRINTKYEGIWQQPTDTKNVSVPNGMGQLTVRFEEDALEARYDTHVARRVFEPGHRVSDIAYVRLSGARETVRRPGFVNLWRLWRLIPPVGAIERPETASGLTAVIFARDAADVLETAVRQMSALADDIVIVDAHSGDQTLRRAFDLQATNYKIRVAPLTVPFPDSESAYVEGSSHVAQTTSSALTWAVGLSRTHNVLFWDAHWRLDGTLLQDFIAEKNIRTRGDQFVVYGASTAEKQPTRYHPLIFSARHGARFAPLERVPALEPLQAAKALQFHLDRPVALRTGGADVIGWMDQRHATEPAAGRYGLPAVEGDDAARMAVSALPPVLRRMPDGLVTEPMDEKGRSLFVAIIGCMPRLARLEAIRASWARDLRLAGIGYAFVVGRPNQPTMLVDDILYVDAPDDYEHLSWKVGEAVRYVERQTPADYLLKIDDDIVLDTAALLVSGYDKADYVGGLLVHSDTAARNWHFGKCRNPQLNDRLLDTDGDLKWFSGGHGYFLSRKAMRCIAGNPEPLRSAMYEDIGIARSLALGGIVAGSTIPNFQAISHARLMRFDDRGSAMINDVPSAEELTRVYREVVQPQVEARLNQFKRRYRVVSRRAR